MSNDGKFWAIFYSSLVVLILGVFFIGTSYYTDKNREIVSAIKGGANPLGVLCALDDTMGDNPTCVILATKGGE